MIPPATELERKIIARLRRDGPMTFRQFMQSALYDETFGYYNTERAKIGPQGDYYTSSNVHRALGRVLARAMVDLWGESSLTVVEMGAGTGRLALDVLDAMREYHPSVFERLTYVIVERSPAMRRAQEESLKDFSGRVRWDSLEEVARRPAAGIFFSNELVDAMPVHRVRLAADDCLEEQYVIADGSRLALRWDAPSTSRLDEYLDRCGANLKEGWTAEINLDALVWLGQVSRAMERGCLITIDYGDLSAQLYGPDRRAGTLRSFYRHRLVDSPLERIGEQDVTASVNFTALIEYGRDAGFERVSYERQSAFLLRYGLIDIIAGMEASSGAIDDIKDRLAIKNLFLPGGVSDNFRVLIQRKPGLHPALLKTAI
jgi:SAM-dependent MidA family methyltransferase